MAPRQDPYRHLRMALPALGGGLLSRRPAERRFPRLLSRKIPDGRNQQLLLPAAGRGNHEGMEKSGSRGLSFRHQGQPISHPHEEAQGGPAAARGIPGPGRPPGRQARPGPVPVATALALQYRASPGISVAPAGALQLCLEFRDKSWFAPEVYKALGEAGAAFCIFELAGLLSPKEITANFVYVRLHCPGDSYQGNYDTRTLAGWAGAISTWQSQGREIFCYFDNDQNGYAARNARELAEMMPA